MGLAAFNRMRMQRIEAMKPENIKAEPKIEEPIANPVVEEAAEKEIITSRKRIKR